jgi:hypothetical protein
MTAEGKVKDVDAMCAAVPDTLTWIPPNWKENKIEKTSRSGGGGGGGGGAGGASTSAAAAAANAVKNDTVTKFVDCSYQLVVSNSFHGKAIVCEWTEHRDRGGIAAAKKGNLWEYSINADTGDDEDEDVLDELDEAEFAFEPACWTEIKPEQPPRLVLDISKGYPVGVAAAVEKGRDIQKLREIKAMKAAADSNNGNTLSATATAAEGGEEEENLALQQQKEQQVVRLLPSPWTGPAFLGISIIPLHQEWKNKSKSALNTGIAEGAVRQASSNGRGGSGSGGVEALVAMLSPTQEIVIAELRNTTTISTTTTTTTAAPVLQILNPVAPPTAAVAVAAAGNGSGRGGTAGAAGAGAVVKKKVDTYPQFNVKQRKFSLNILKYPSNITQIINFIQKIKSGSV